MRLLAALLLVVLLGAACAGAPPDRRTQVDDLTHRMRAMPRVQQANSTFNDYRGCQAELDIPSGGNVFLVDTGGCPVNNGDWTVSAGKQHPAEIRTSRRRPTDQEMGLWTALNANQSIPHADVFTINGPHTGPLWVSEKIPADDPDMALPLAQEHLPLVARLSAPIVYTAQQPVPRAHRVLRGSHRPGDDHDRRLHHTEVPAVAGRTDADRRVRDMQAVNRVAGARRVRAGDGTFGRGGRRAPRLRIAS